MAIYLSRCTFRCSLEEGFVSEKREYASRSLAVWSSGINR